MQLGMIGLGRMGSNMVRRLMRKGHQCVVFDRSADAVKGLESEGAAGAAALADFVKQLTKPRTVWLMVPAGAVDASIADLTPLLERGDCIIDGGNSYYIDDIRRAKELQTKGIDYVDVGTSGGVWGLERGYCMMIGGPDATVQRLDPIFDALAPGAGDVERTPGRPANSGTAERGYLHCGQSGGGHFVKMVHNGIEYGMMAAYAEGLGVLKSANIGKKTHATDAETTPLRDPEHYQYDFDLAEVTEVWRRGSVIASWLLDLTAGAMIQDPDLAKFAGRVSDSGEGRWTIKAAIDEGVPTPVLTTSLYARFSSRGEADFQNKVLSAMRFGFGGHLEVPHDEKPANRMLAAALALAAALLAGGPARAADPYELNVILSMTGTAGFVGQGNAVALAALEKYVNATGGIDGAPLKFVISDDQSNPQTAVQVANAILAKKPQVVLGSDLSAICNAAAAVFKDGPLLYCFSSGVRPEPGSWFFGNFTPTDDAIAVVLRFAREKGWSRLAFVTSTDATGLDADKAIDNGLALPENKGLSGVDREHFGVTDLSTAAQISRIKAANAQAVVVWTTGTPFGTILSSISQVGLGIPVIALGSNASFVEMKQYASILPKELYFPGTLPLTGAPVPDRQVRAAIDVMNKALLSNGAPNDFVNEIPWDPAALVVATLRKLGPAATPLQIKNSIAAERNWPGINGRYDFVAHPQRGLGVTTWVMLRWDPAKNYWTGVSKPGGGLK